VPSALGLREKPRQGASANLKLVSNRWPPWAELEGQAWTEPDSYFPDANDLHLG